MLCHRFYMLTVKGFKTKQSEVHVRFVETSPTKKLDEIMKRVYKGEQKSFLKSFYYLYTAEPYKML